MNKRSRPTRSRSRLIQGCLGAAGLIGIASNCLAADRSWGNSAGGNFTTTTNWINGLLAGVNDVAVFDRSRGTSQTSYTVSFSSSVQNQAVSVANDLVTFSLGGRTYTTTQITGNEIGTSATGLQARLTISNGTVNVTGALTPQILVGALPGATGSLTLTSSAVLTGSPKLLIGTPSATGFFTINSGTATVSTLSLGSGAAGRGTAVVTGPFSNLTTGSLIVGDAGIGTMLIDIAGTFTNNGTAKLGNLAGSTGVVTLDGNSRWFQQNGLLAVGGSGAATINVLSGSRLTGSTAVMASAAGSTATVRVDGPGSGSQWTNTGTLTIADFGAATLTVGGGGLLSAGTTTLGNGTSSLGVLNVDGTGSQATFGRFLVGGFGNATINVTGGATLSAGTTSLAGAEGTRATVNIAGPGSSATVGRLTVGFNGQGTINVSNGGRLVSGGDVAQFAGGFNATDRGGAVNVTGPGSAWINAGSIDFGFQSRAFLTITGGGTVECNGADLNTSGFAGVTVDGAGSRWVNHGTFRLFSPSLSITNGGVVENTNAVVDAESFVIVEGLGSRWINAGSLEIGAFFRGNLSIRDRGQVTAGDLFVQDEGRLSVSSFVGQLATGAQLTVADLVLGTDSFGGGTLSLDSGGSVRSAAGHIVGNSSLSFRASSVRISGTNAKWDNDGSLTVGGAESTATPAHAKLDVLSGGSVHNLNAFIAISPSSNGTVTVGGFNSKWTTTGNLYVGGSTVSAGGSGTLIINSFGDVIVTDTLSVWNDGVVNLNGGSLTVGSIAFPGSTFNFISGTLRLTGPAQLDSTFLDKTLGPGHVIKTLQHLSIAGTPTLSSPLVLDGGILTVPTLAGNASLQFDGGTLNLTAANLTIGSGGLLGGDIVLDDRNINVTNATTIASDGRLTFRGGSFLSGAGITNDGQIVVDAPTSANLRNPLVNNGELNVASGAVMNFFGDVTGSGSFTGGGTKVFTTGSNSTVGPLDTPGGTIVNTGATLAASRIREQSLIIHGTVRILPNGTSESSSRLNSLLLFGTAKLDLADNELVVDYTGASPITQIAPKIVAGRNGGSWNGNGITSSAAAAQPFHATTLGILESSEYIAATGASTFAGQSIDSSALLVKYTWYGDADFNGIVNFDDYSRIDNGFSLSRTGWLNGDFDLNGVVNFDDYALIDLAFNAQNGTLLRAIEYANGDDRSLRGMGDPALQMLMKHTAEFGSGYGQVFLAAVPEPSTSVVTALAMVTCVGRARRVRRRTHQ